MKQTVTIVSISTAALLAVGVATAAPPANLPVSISQARAVALKAAAGEIKDSELEKQEGAHGPRYAFEIHTAGGLREVVVDAHTGQVIANKAESGVTEKSEGTSGDEAREGKPEHEQAGEHED